MTTASRNKFDRDLFVVMILVGIALILFLKGFGIL
jgi:hypothetical protein